MASGSLPDDKDIQAAIRGLLKTADLDTVTPRSMRQQLCEQFGVDLSEKKAFIKETIIAELTRQSSRQSESECESSGAGGSSEEEEVLSATTSDADATARAKKRHSAVGRPEPASVASASEPEPSSLDSLNKGKTAFQYELELAPALANFLEAKTMTRSEATKRIWAYCKEKQLPSAKGTYTLDAPLSAALGRKTLNFKTMAKALSANMAKYHRPENPTAPSRQPPKQTASAPVPTPPRKKPKAPSRVAGSATKPVVKREKPAVVPAPAASVAAPPQSKMDVLNKGKTAFQYELQLSPTLGKFLQAATMTRAEATKRIWAYCKEKQLPHAKGKYQLDEALSMALGRKTLEFKTLAKALAANMQKYHKPEAQAVKRPSNTGDNGSSGKRSKS